MTAVFVWLLIAALAALTLWLAFANAKTRLDHDTRKRGRS